MARTDPRPNYGSKRRTRNDGYIDVWDPQHPLARRDGYVAEHRRVAWEAGVLTDPSLDVHHRNGDRTDNRIENLEAITGAEHTRVHGLKGAALRHALKTHCPQGHAYDEANTYYDRSGGRYCRECMRRRQREHYARKRAALGL